MLYVQLGGARGDHQRPRYLCIRKAPCYQFRDLPLARSQANRVDDVQHAFGAVRARRRPGLSDAVAVLEEGRGCLVEYLDEPVKVGERRRPARTLNTGAEAQVCCVHRSVVTLWLAEVYGGFPVTQRQTGRGEQLPYVDRLARAR